MSESCPGFLLFEKFKLNQIYIYNLQAIFDDEEIVMTYVDGCNYPTAIVKFILNSKNPRRRLNDEVAYAIYNEKEGVDLGISGFEAAFDTLPEANNFIKKFFPTHKMSIWAIPFNPIW